MPARLRPFQVNAMAWSKGTGVVPYRVCGRACRDYVDGFPVPAGSNGICALTVYGRPTPAPHPDMCLPRRRADLFRNVHGASAKCAFSWDALLEGWGNGCPRREYVHETHQDAHTSTHITRQLQHEYQASACTPTTETPRPTPASHPASSRKQPQGTHPLPTAGAAGRGESRRWETHRRHGALPEQWGDMAASRSKGLGKRPSTRRCRLALGALARRHRLRETPPLGRTRRRPPPRRTQVGGQPRFPASGDVAQTGSFGPTLANPNGSWIGGTLRQAIHPHN